MSHITKEQRYIIEVLLSKGGTQKMIADYLNKPKSTISREILRNSDGRSGLYSYDLAQRKYNGRQDAKRKFIRLTKEIKEFIEVWLAEKYSPEQIVGKAKKMGQACVSHERIYQYVWEDKKNGGNLHHHLRTEGKRYRHRGASKDRRGVIANRRDITERPAVVESRERFGDIEIDTIIGKDHKGAILTMVDRSTGVLKMKKLKSKDADQLAVAMVETLKPWQRHLKTITSDNGKEFASHEQIAKKLNIDFYFAKPYHSWERGTNENTNGLVRQYILKKTDFNEISEVYIQYVEDQLNNRPRKRFNFNSPIEIFNQKVAFVT